MTTPLWAKNDTALDDELLRFMVGDDLRWDAVLLPYDIRATIAHVQGLCSINVLKSDDANTLVGALESLAADVASGEFILDDRFEDGHTAIEDGLVARLGDLGKRVHLGRSRNDQVLVATRLYTRDALGMIRVHVLAAAGAALDVARRHEMTPMPGYTHLQRAVPSTVGLWMASYVESCIDDAMLLGATIDWLDACPLGTAAGYGVNLPLPRESVGAELGFGRLQVNPMYAQASRGKFEVQALSAVWQAMQDLRRLGWDLALFASAEYGFVSLAPEATTGSSIMPNKRNPDVAELLRAGATVVVGAMAEIQNVTSLPSGYHRDLQLTKAPLIRAMQSALQACAIAPRVIAGLTIHADRMRAAIDPALGATDKAVELAVAGAPFRDAYRIVGESLRDLGSIDADESVRKRVSPGACADLRLDFLASRLAEARRQK
jgi:argininosuccinate lyase